ncbi:uncharacterized protein LOC142646246 [Dermatophagoides pteronyssinus]|uniref:uncharacterized protein LOC142646246 n=1 Tax=Dermatophagoides pteronyssinus TaxID=6956 RepID=UPI003F67CB8C
MEMVLENRSFGIIVSLDIAGAFNNANFDVICQRLRFFNVPTKIYRVFVDFFKNREVILPMFNCEARKILSAGCPQGGKSSPILWNCLIDDLLKLPLPSNCYIQAFADDIILFCHHDNSSLCFKLINESLNAIWSWGNENFLQFNPNKSTALIVTRKRKYDTVSRLKMNNFEIPIVSNMKYLGVFLDGKLTWSKHLEYVSAKVLKIYNVLRRKFGSRWGLSYSVLRTIYLMAIEPVLLYACSTWIKAIDIQRNCQKLLSIQRLFAISMIKGYRTISYSASFIIANILPIDIKAKMLSKIYVAKRSGSFVDPFLNEIIIDRTCLFDPNLIQYFNYSDGDIDSCQIQHKMKIFTDGSKIDGRVGGAFVVFEDDENIPVYVEKFRLANTCTVFQAELLAIYKAICWLSNRNCPAKIYSDSKSVLLACKNFGVKTDLFNSIYEKLKITAHICFEWIRGHSGIIGNEIADINAKDATQLEVVSYNTIPLSFIRSICKEAAVFEWQQRWIGSMTGLNTKIFFPSVKSRIECKNFFPNFDTTQLISGHGKLKSYLFRFNLINDSSCLCGQCNQDSSHLLFECEKFNTLRQDFLNQIHINLDQSNMNIIIKNFSFEFSIFCKNILSVI